MKKLLNVAVVLSLAAAVTPPSFSRSLEEVEAEIRTYQEQQAAHQAARQLAARQKRQDRQEQLKKILKVCSPLQPVEALTIPIKAPVEIKWRDGGGEKTFNLIVVSPGGNETEIRIGTVREIQRPPSQTEFTLYRDRHEVPWQDIAFWNGMVYVDQVGDFVNQDLQFWSLLDHIAAEKGRCVIDNKG